VKNPIYLYISLLVSVLIGAIVRLHAISPFKIYPDSYQNLLVAENIKTYHSVVGYLGPQGVFYPDFFIWTRPVYALFIDTVSIFHADTVQSAQAIALFAGISAILLAFLFLKTLFKSSLTGLSGAFLLALSYNHTVWSGFIMTETTGVFLMLLFLWRFFATISQETKLWNTQNMITGMVFGLAVLSRYEYLVISLPVIMVVFFLSPKPRHYLITSSLGFISVVLLAAFTLFPVHEVLPVIFRQLSDFFVRAGILIAGILFVLVLILLLRKHLRSRASLATGVLGFVFLATLYTLLQLVIGSRLGFLWTDLAFVRNFMIHEPLMTSAALFGLFLMVRKRPLKPYAYFSLLAIGSLGSIYHHINSDMERYLTHVIPFLLIPASFGFARLLQTLRQTQGKTQRSAMTVVLLLLIGWQSVATFQGLGSLGNPSWFRTSYEEKSALMLKKYLQKDEHVLLLTSLPEPYYFFTDESTQSLTDVPPYIYLPKTFDEQRVLIVEDMGMHVYFPTFSTVLSTKFAKYTKATYRVQEQFHYENTTFPEKYPVTLYEIKLSDLRKVLAGS
jgi:hypothetical protein